MKEKTPYVRMPLWRLVDIATLEMTDGGKEYFTRKEICDYINDVLIKNADGRKETESISPVIQGVTVNAPGGAPGAVNRRILYRVDRGLYRRVREGDEDALPFQGGKEARERDASRTRRGERERGGSSSSRSLLEGILEGLAEEELYTVRVEEDGGIILPEGIMKGMGIKPGDLLVFQPLEGRKCMVKRGRLRLEVDEG